MDVFVSFYQGHLRRDVNISGSVWGGGPGSCGGKGYVGLKVGGLDFLSFHYALVIRRSRYTLSDDKRNSNSNGYAMVVSLHWQGLHLRPGVK